MVKKILYFFLILFIGLVVAYWLQPLKKGKGLDTNTHYKLVEDWLQLPDSIKLGNPTGIGIDSSDNIVVFHRSYREWPLIGSMPKSKITSSTILFIDHNSGRLIKSWGSNLFVMPHGLTVDHENNIWVTDVGLHQVFKFSHDGKLLLTLGEAGKAGKDAAHFNKPTDVAVATDNSFYVSDGYDNSRVIKFSANGNYLFQWGKKGNGQGEFNIPHSVTLDKKGNVYVADRENQRIQIFTADGKFIKEFAAGSFGNMCAVAFDTISNKLVAVDDHSFLKIKHRGSDVFVFDTTGMVLTRFGRSGDYSGSSTWYHDLVSCKGDIYVTDILKNRVQKFQREKAKGY